MSISDISYSVLLPLSPGGFHDQWQDCLDQLKANTEDVQYKIFKMNIFVHSTDKSGFLARKEVITAAVLKIFGNECPAFGVLPISPEQDINIAIELGKVRSSGIRIIYRKYNTSCYTILENDTYKELWVNGIEKHFNNTDTLTAARNSFDLLSNILFRENMSFNNIIRQWNYIGNILKVSSGGIHSDQNYQVFNKVRHDYYSKLRSVPGYPAATGVGMDYDGVTIDICAINKTSGTETFSINNPVQINPYSYDQEVLSVIKAPDTTEKQPPLFERALLLTDGNKFRLFVSGTASIIGQETTGKEHLAEQTLITIDNIKRLTSSENIKSYYPAMTLKNIAKLSRIRVYVKNTADIFEVKSICSAQFEKIPAVYLQADICRNDLLVEIEAELTGLR